MLPRKTSNHDHILLICDRTKAGTQAQIKIRLSKKIILWKTVQDNRQKSKSKNTGRVCNQESNQIQADNAKSVRTTTQWETKQAEVKTAKTGKGLKNKTQCFTKVRFVLSTKRTETIWQTKLERAGFKYREWSKPNDKQANKENGRKLTMTGSTPNKVCRVQSKWQGKQKQTSKCQTLTGRKRQHTTLMGEHWQYDIRLTRIWCLLIY